MKISPRTLRNYIDDVRDRCAHLRMRSDALGVTMLSNKDASEVDSVLPLVTKICAIAVNRHLKTKGFRIAGLGIDHRSAST